MEIEQRFIEAIKGLQPDKWAFNVAEVISSNGNTCTVRVGDTELPDVRLSPTADGKIIMHPRPGSYVLIGSQSGGWVNCYVLACDEVAKIELTHEGLTIEIDAETGLIDIHNNTVSVGGLFKELADLLATKLQVFTRAGVSGTAIPSTVAAVNKFTANVNKLFK